MPNLPPLVYAMLLAPLALILIAAIVKTWQAREARSWPQVSGKVVTSVAEVREVRVSDDEREDGYRMESRNFANVDLRIFGERPETELQPHLDRRGPRQFPGRREAREIPGRQHRHGLLQSAPSRSGGAGARSAEGPVGLSRHRLGDRGRHHLRLGVRPQPELQLARASRRPARSWRAWSWASARSASSSR